jgi:hypothetical protein
MDCLARELPRHDDLLWPVVRALRQLDGSADNDQLIEKVSELLGLPDELTAIPHKSGPCSVGARPFLVVPDAPLGEEALEQSHAGAPPARRAVGSRIRRQSEVGGRGEYGPSRRPKRLEARLVAQRRLRPSADPIFRPSRNGRGVHGRSRIAAARSNRRRSHEPTPEHAHRVHRSIPIPFLMRPQAKPGHLPAEPIERFHNVSGPNNQRLAEFTTVVPQLRETFDGKRPASQRPVRLLPQLRLRDIEWKHRTIPRRLRQLCVIGNADIALEPNDLEHRTFSRSSRARRTAPRIPAYWSGRDAASKRFSRPIHRRIVHSRHGDP